MSPRPIIRHPYTWTKYGITGPEGEAEETHQGRDTEHSYRAYGVQGRSSLTKIPSFFATQSSPQHILRYAPLCSQTHTLRLKRTYQRKSEEVRNLQQASEAIAGSPSGSTSGSTPIASGYVSPTSHHHHHQQSSLHLSPEAGSSGSRSGSRPTSRSGLDGGFEAGSSGHRSTGKGDILISGASERIFHLHDTHGIVLTGCIQHPPC